MPKTRNVPPPWYARKNGDALIYLLTAIFFVELIVGGAAFFYGIIHAAPETPGGPPLARFPWLGWSVCAILCPVGLLLLLHLAGMGLSGALAKMEGETGAAAPDKDESDARVPESMRRFYAMARSAPLIVILTAILLLGAALYFIDGAFAAFLALFHDLLPYMPWICASLGGLLALCFVVHAIMVYRQRKLEHEYAWRREVLQKTGIVLIDKKTAALGDDASRIASLAEAGAAPGVLDVPGRALPSPPSKMKGDE